MMCAKLLKKSDPKRILVVSLTNIGDVVLTCPVIDILRRDFPRGQNGCGDRAQGCFTF